jgi:hypothetical protein
MGASGGAHRFSCGRGLPVAIRVERWPDRL